VLLLTYRAINNNLEVADSEWAEVAKFGETVAEPPMTEQVENGHYMIAGCDPAGDETARTYKEWCESSGKVEETAQKNIAQEVELQSRQKGRPALEHKRIPENEDPDNELELL
jgi:hypothetical protein